MTVNNVLLAPEPAIFDSVNLILSAQWLDWYSVRHMANVGKSTEAGTEKLRNLMNVIPLVSKDPNTHPDLVTQLEQMASDIKKYFVFWDLFESIKDKGYLQFMKPGDPSLFARTGASIDLRAWAISSATENGIAQQYLKSYVMFIIQAINAIKPEDYALSQPIPAIESMLDFVPSMHWVLDTKFRTGRDICDIHDEGVLLLAPPEYPTKTDGEDVTASENVIDDPDQ